MCSKTPCLKKKRVTGKWLLVWITLNIMLLVVKCHQVEGMIGLLKWKFKTKGDVWSSPAIAQDGTIYVGSVDDYLYAINLNGSLKWKFRIGNYWRIPKYLNPIDR